METLAFRSAQSIIRLAVSRDHPRDVGQFPDIAIEGLMAAVLTDNDAELSVDRVLERPEAAHKVLGLVCRDNRNDNARGGANSVRDFRHSTPLPIGQSRMPSETLFAKCRRALASALRRATKMLLLAKPALMFWLKWPRRF
jgi:hypothetical protein